MHAFAVLAALSGVATAIRGPDPRLPTLRLHPRDGAQAEPTSPWVSLDDEGRPATTFTPSMTTISGTPSAVNGAPHDLTASVYTMTNWGVITTSTGSPPNPTPTANGNQGAFSRCFNTDGDFAPFCRPSHNSTLLAGSTYYVTWDPDYYNKTGSGLGSNTTYEVTVRLDFWNTTSSAWDKLTTFDESRVPAAWGFFPLAILSSYLMNEKLNNLTITLLAGPMGSQDKTNSVALPIAVAKPALPQNRAPAVPKGTALYIALPIVLVAFIGAVIGGCIWNQKTRRIELGSIMSRSRRGYSGRRMRAARLFRGDDKDSSSIPLHQGGAAPTGGAADVNADLHVDADADVGVDTYRDMPDRGRRDSDVLGSLAESPVSEDFEHRVTGGMGGNAFREEIARQHEERSHAY